MVVMITIVVMMAMMMVMIMVSQEMAVDDDANIIDMADLKRPEANITCHGGSNMTRTTLDKVCKKAPTSIRQLTFDQELQRLSHFTIK